MQTSQGVSNKSSATKSNWIAYVLLALAVSSNAVSKNVGAQEINIEDRIGYPEFRLHCAVCHGKSGEGEGAISGLLAVKSEQLDLRNLKKNNNGEYPYRRVFQVIDGRQNVAAHGERLMPIWGDRYSINAEAAYGAYDAEAVVNGRILELVYFIQGIQK